ADLRQAELPGKFLLVAPHLAGIALTVWASRHHPAAAVVALTGSVTMAGLWWWDTLDRETEGHDWQFNNALSEGICCGANYVVLCLVACVAGLIALSGGQPPPDSGAAGKSSEVEQQE